MFDYATTAAEASEAIRDAGAPVILRQQADGDYDASSSEVEGGDKKHAGFGLMVEYDNRHIDGTSVLAGDVRILIAVHRRVNESLSLADHLPEPNAGDLVTMGSETWRVVRPKILKPAMVPVMFEVQARK